MIVRFPQAEVLVEVARTPQRIVQGLRGAPPLADDRGLLFAMSATHVWPFTMDGVFFPLDMIFMDEAGVVVGLIEGATPNTYGPYVVRAPSRWVLEVRGGWADRHDVSLGDRATFG